MEIAILARFLIPLFRLGPQDTTAGPSRCGQEAERHYCKEPTFPYTTIYATDLLKPAINNCLKKKEKKGCLYLSKKKEKPHTL